MISANVSIVGRPRIRGDAVQGCRGRDVFGGDNHGVARGGRRASQATNHVEADCRQGGEQCGRPLVVKPPPPPASLYG
jgi:hypothetical protein